MTAKPDVRSYNNPWPPRFSAAAQNVLLTGEVYVEDKTGAIVDALIRSVRKGTVVEVVELGLLAPVKGKPAKRRAMMAERVETIRKRGGHIVEIASGWSTAAGQCARMLVRGSEFIASSGRTANKKGRAGHPGIDLTPDLREAAAGIWTSRKYGNDKDRLDAIEKRIGRRLKRGWCWQHFGSPNGRQSNE